jgi:hypothetical protein
MFAWETCRVASVANEMGACLTLRQRNQELDRHRDRGAEANLMPQLAFACGVVGRHDMMSQLLLMQYPTGWGPAFCFQGQWHCVSFV